MILQQELALEKKPKIETEEVGEMGEKDKNRNKTRRSFRHKRGRQMSVSANISGNPKEELEPGKRRTCESK